LSLPPLTRGFYTTGGEARFVAGFFCPEFLFLPEILLRCSMSLADLKSQLPDYAKDLRLNL